jgi:N-acyl amino acid synthase of PEP-CTERM/exosortase system
MMQSELATADRYLGVRLRRFRSPTYDEAFEGIAADTEQLRRECYRVRHQIYCQERRFLQADDQSGGLETDEHDGRSLHALLRYRKTGEFVGTVRLIVPQLGVPGLRPPLYSLLERAGLDTASLLPPLALTAEISRFAVSRDFRRRLGDARFGVVTEPDEEDRRSIPHMALGLMAMAFAMSRRCGSEYLCAVMEPSLIRLLARFAIRWQEVGPLIEHHGVRQPCIARIDEMAATVAAERPDIWEFIAHPRGAGVGERMPSIGDCPPVAA